MKYCNTGIINCKNCWDWDKDKCKVGLHNPNDKVDTAIAARDKEWVEWLLKALQYCGLGCSKNISLKFSITSGTIVPECFFLEDSCRVWQERKKEITI